MKYASQRKFMALKDRKFPACLDEQQPEMGSSYSKSGKDFWVQILCARVLISHIPSTIQSPLIVRKNRLTSFYFGGVEHLIVSIIKCT
jgi:hypothetical protein